jgi:4-hydroxybenzoate polyprenyltransferase
LAKEFGDVMNFKQIASFVKIEHTLFSLPFILIGALMAGTPSNTQLLWIIIAAIGARGLAMGLNRIIDREVDAVNPRTAGRHLASGSMNMRTAWLLCTTFLVMLLIGAWRLNPLALQLSWIPVLAFVIYPYLKRFTWLCHWWLGVCLALAPAGAWVGITGEISSLSWWPELFIVSLGVMIWIASFDLGYALMDIDSDKENGIHSFPAKYGIKKTTIAMYSSIPVWGFCFAQISIIGAIFAVIFTLVVLKTQKEYFQKWWFNAHVCTGWILLIAMQLS